MAIFSFIALACDHAGVSLSGHIQDYLQDNGYGYENLGALSDQQSLDYPLYIEPVVHQVLRRGAGGILVCGSGIGMSIGANRFPGIRAALCHDVTTAVLARQHNDANILVLGERLLGIRTALDCLKAFLTTSFEGGRHTQRLEQLDRFGNDLE